LDLNSIGKSADFGRMRAAPGRMRAPGMRALSIRQPYAEMILRGEKTIEDRSRPAPGCGSSASGSTSMPRRRAGMARRAIRDCCAGAPGMAPGM
jgi:hypothetical protein